MSDTPTYEITDLVETTESKKERSLRILCDDSFMDKVYESLCLGSSLANIAESRDIGYADLVKYVNANEVRKKQLAEALDMRRQYLVDKVIQQTIDISASDLRQLFGANGELLPPDQWPDHIGPAIESVEIKEVFEGAGHRREHVGYTKKIKLWNKINALKMLGQEHGVFKDKKEIGVSDSLMDLVVRSYEPKEAEVIEVKNKEDK